MKYKKGDKVWYYNGDRPQAVEILAVDETFGLYEIEWHGIWKDVGEDALYPDKASVAEAVESDIEIMQAWVKDLKEGK